jgi:hypothetical protein
MASNLIPLSGSPAALPPMDESSIDTAARKYVLLDPAVYWVPVYPAVHYHVTAVHHYELVRGAPFLSTEELWPTPRCAHRNIADIMQSLLVFRQGIFDLPFTSRDNIFVSRAMSPGEILAGLSDSVTAIDSTNPIDQILSQANELCNLQGRSEDIPTSAACESARRILTETQRIAPICLDATAVEASDGDLLIHWDTPSRSVVLICPRDGRAPSIYTETLEGVRPIASHLRGDVSAQSLSEALAWVLPPTR